MAVAALAGRFSPDRRAQPGAGEALVGALRRDGPAAAATLGPMAVACTPAGALDADGDPVLCLLDGRPRTGRLAELLELDPGTPPERLIATGWRVLGERLLARLDGEFALLVWDRERMSGTLARDRLGARPLFLAERGGELLFASEVRNLLEALPGRPPPDGVAVAHWLARTVTRDERTLYRGITRLPAGHALLLDQRGWRPMVHWRPAYSPPQTISAAEAAAEARAALGRAVARSIEGAERPAVMLSGGLDSAAVAAAARAERPGAPPSVYSAVFPADPLVDESARIGLVRERLGLDAVEMQFQGGRALAAAVEFQREWELPSVSPNLFVWLPLLRRAAADGVDVLLDGEGGDELFGCARYLVADRLRRGRVVDALRVARRLPGMGEAPRARWLRRALVSYGLRGSLPAAAHARLRAARGGHGGPTWLGEDASALVASGHDPWAWKLLPGPRWWAQLADQLTAAGDAFGTADQLRREGALTGVELRHPLRDPELIDLVLGLPPELGFHPRVDRPLLRRALADELPAETLASDEKPAFNSLLSAALGGDELPAVRALLSDPHPELARRVRRDALAALVDPGAPELRTRGWALDLWRLATLELWLDHQADPGAAKRTREGLKPSSEPVFRNLYG